MGTSLDLTVDSDSSPPESPAQLARERCRLNRAYRLDASSARGATLA